MRDGETDVNAIELLQTSRSVSQAQSSYGGSERTDTAGDGLLPSYESDLKTNDSSDDTAPPEKRWPRWMLFRGANELISFLAVVATAIPIILLLRYAPTLSHKLGSQACLPNGDFIFPGTASIWNPAYFFTISITMQGAESDWSYTHVKIIDIIWDVAMGRGGQLTLIYISYRVFSRALAYMMETQAVPYPAYSAVSFETASMRSIWEYLRHAGWTKNEHTTVTWRSSRIFIAMTLASLYVVSMPTLFSAMTGYAALSAPSIELPPIGHEGEYICEDIGGCSVYPCGGSGPDLQAEGSGLLPGWGVVIDSMRVNYGAPWPIAQQDVDGSTGKGDAYYLIQYYERYAAEYKALATDPACRNVSGLQDCPATNKESVFIEPGFVKNLSAPLLNIQLWGNDTATGVPNVWLCAGFILNTYDFNPGNVTGICSAAGTSYQWGFSFLLLLLVCILNLVFAAIVYGLWMDARRNAVTPRKREKKVHPTGMVEWRVVDHPSAMKSVMAIAAQAMNDHGDEVFQWNSKKLNKDVWRGKKGMRARKPFSDGDEAGEQ